MAYFSHRRVRYVKNIFEQGPLSYSGHYSKSNGWTDIRVAIMPGGSILDSELVIAPGKHLPAIGKDHSSKNSGTWFYMNGPFFNGSTRKLLGKTVLNQEVILLDVKGKTENRPHLYSKDGKIGIGRIDDPKGIDWAVCGFTLAKNKKFVFPVQNEVIPSYLVNGPDERTAVGITKDGTVIALFADMGRSDKGMTQREVAEYLISLGAVDVIGLDGGGSSTLATYDNDLAKMIDIKNNYHVCEVGKSPRYIHHALAFKLDKDIIVNQGYKASVAWDAGHGENTFETTGGKGVVVNGSKFEEHWFNAAVVEEIIPLSEHNKIRPVITQPLRGEVDVPLSQRVNKAVSEKVDLLFSIHADANENTEARGNWCFYWGDTSYSRDTLFRNTIVKSKKLAEIWNKYAKQYLPNPNRSTSPHPCQLNHWTNFYMTKIPPTHGIPSILMEHGFMTNSDDLGLLKNKQFIKLCAEVAVRTACEYLGLPFSKPGDSKEGPKQEPKPQPTSPADPTPSGNVIEMSTTAKIIDGSFHVVAREFVEALGGRVESWNQKDQRGVFSYNNIQVSLTHASKNMIVNGAHKVMPTTAKIIDGRFHVIARAFVESLGGYVESWTQSTATAVFVLGNKRITLKNNSNKMIIEDK